MSNATPERATAAQEAYTAYAEVLVPLSPWGIPDFAQLPAIHQHAWEAVATALASRTDLLTNMLYVVVSSAEASPAQIQRPLCGAYSSLNEAEQHVRHAAPAYPHLIFTICTCPFPPPARGKDIR